MIPSGRKFLLVGLGAIGQRHARNLRKLLGDEVELLAYRARRNPTALTEKMEVEGGIDVEAKYHLRVFTDLAEALGEKPNAVIVANPTSLHLPVARAAADAGYHLFIEKPISHTLDGVDELLASVDRQKLVTLVGYQWRFHPLLERLKQTLSTHCVGPIISVLARFGEYLPGWHPYENYRDSYAARRELGGGVLLTQIHDFDYLGWLFGWPHRVFCVGGKLSSLEVDVEDTASTLLECDIDGRHVPIHVHQDYVQQVPERGFRVIGERGTVEVDLSRATYRVQDNQGREIESQSCDGFDRNEIFLAELKHFLACLECREVSRIPVSEGAKSLRVALAAQESLRTGQAIQL
jgi:predicted dehydrogenase